MRTDAHLRSLVDDELAKCQYDLLFASDALALGRKTFESLAATMAGARKNGGDCAVRMNVLPKCVASRSLKAPSRGAVRF
jgi:hypothetical protein